MGASLPGCPLFGVGRTERLSWGVTYMKCDTIDYFIEDCRPGGATGWQYRRGQEWRISNFAPKLSSTNPASPKRSASFITPREFSKATPPAQCRILFVIQLDR